MTERSRAKKSWRQIDGILLVDKPRGQSSNSVLQQAKRAFSARKAGHTGNLDVLASGLLPVCFGEATKISAFLLEADKGYVADVTLGVVTRTGDEEGEIVSRRRVPDINEREFERVLERFRGPIMQIPPMHSALKRNGQRLYKLAHKGIEIEREPRPVTIHEIEVLARSAERLQLRVRCSKGTYIRTLAEDIGEALGCGAHLAGLRRTLAWPFDIKNAAPLADILSLVDDDAGFAALDAMLLPIDAALIDLPDLRLTEAGACGIGHGQAVHVAEAPASGLVRLYEPSSRFLGVGRILDDGRVAPRRLMRSGQ